MTHASTPQVATPTPTLFGREPALALGVVSGAIQFLASTVLPLTDTQQGVLNVAVSALVGLVVAVRVKGGTWAAALLALVQALIAAALAFKFDLSADVQVGVMVLVTTVLGFVTRQVVDPPQAKPTPGSSAVA
jgi:hypothetical protein